LQRCVFAKELQLPGAVQLLETFEEAPSQQP
jgi:hypothetical protein